MRTVLTAAALLLATGAQARMPGLTHITGKTSVGLEYGRAFVADDTFDISINRVDLFGEAAIPFGKAAVSVFAQTAVGIISGGDDTETGVGNLEVGAAYTLTGEGWRLPLALSASLPTADRQDLFKSLLTSPVRVRDLYGQLDETLVRLNASPVLALGAGRLMLDVGVNVPTDEDIEGVAAHLGVGGAMPLTAGLELRGSFLGTRRFGVENPPDTVYEASVGVGYAATPVLDLNAALSVPLADGLTEDIPAALHLGVQASF